MMQLGNTTDAVVVSEEDIQTTTTSCKRDPNTEERHYNGKLVHESPPVPPDGGYGWVVVAASFVCNFVIDGISFSVGILNTEFLRIFGESNSKTAWIGSLLTGYGFVGPLVAALTMKFGCRTVTTYGSALTSLGFLFAPFSYNVTSLIVSIGIMGGVHGRLSGQYYYYYYYYY
ncbi:Monocarboxylate transporter 10 [Lamellibrachia satsuma]|nr:Monocarboxylate transporter 10 [Lamellibrachia satsuma]